MTNNERKLRDFAVEIIRQSWQCIDGGDVETIAIQHGLLVEVSYDPKKHGEMEDTVPGDMIYAFANWITEDYT